MKYVTFWRMRTEKISSRAKSCGNTESHTQTHFFVSDGTPYETALLKTLDMCNRF